MDADHSTGTIIIQPQPRPGISRTHRGEALHYQCSLWTLMKLAAMLAKRRNDTSHRRGSNPEAQNHHKEDGRESLKKTIRNLYGEVTLKKVNSFTKLRKSLNQRLCTLAFLRRCRDQKVIPRFLQLKSPVDTKQSRRILQQTGLVLTRERINSVKKELDQISKRLLHLHLEITSVLERGLWDTVDRVSHSQACRTQEIRTQKQQEKFQKLTTPRQKPPAMVDTVRNLTDEQLSEAAVTALAKGTNFAMTPRIIPTEEIICQVESAIRTLPPETANEIRRTTANALKQSKPPSQNLSRQEKLALKELKSNPDILVLPADKGNSTVVMNKEDYTNKVRALLQDAKTYRKIKKDPTSSIESKTTRLIKAAGLPPDVTRQTIPKESQPPRLYGLPKIHKPNIPIRPIVSAIGSPTHRLAKYLAKILLPLTGKTESYIRNSTHFIEKIKDIKLQPGDILVSFDVESLFTNVPTRDTIEIIKNLQVPNNLIPLIEHCLDSTYFQFQGEVYEQVSGAAMGSPISPVVANIFMEHLEDRICREAPLKPTKWFRYVDDTFIVWSHGKDRLPSFLDFINSLHNNIHFTMEIESENRLPFLDVLVTRRTDGTLGHRVYRKPTHTDRYLNAESHHHPAQKQSVINSLVDRAIKISEPAEMKKELEHLKKALQKNGYNKTTINRTINKHLTRQDDRPHDDKTEETLKGIAFLPYLQGTTDRIGRILRKHNIKTVYKPPTKIGQVLTSPKDARPPLAAPGIYKIPCACGQVYIGETGRSVNTRLKEHERCSRYNNIQSAIAEHRLITGHNILFDKTEMITRSSSLFPRRYREALEIAKHPNNFNRDNGLQLSPIWSTLLPVFN